MENENVNEQTQQQEGQAQETQQQEAVTNQQDQGKTYTQAQIKSMMAREKRTARQATLKELGFDVTDDQTYADAVSNIKKTLDAGKSQQQLDKEAKKRAETTAKEATARAELAELKVSALSAGIKPDRLDDMLILAKSKMTAGQTMDQAFNALKESYPDAFGVGSSGGTGSHVNPGNKNGSSGESRGTRLAKQNKPSGKSSYFKH